MYLKEKEKKNTFDTLGSIYVIKRWEQPKNFEIFPKFLGEVYKNY